MDDWIIDIINENKIKTYDIKKESDFCNQIDLSKFDVFYAGMSFCVNKDYIPDKLKMICILHDLRNFEEPIDSVAIGRILMALNKPIDENIIKEEFDRIVRRQNEDLDKICDIMLGV